MRSLFKSVHRALHLRRKTLAIAICGAALTVAASAAEAPALSAANPAVVARATTLRQGDAWGNRLAATKRVEVTVALKLRNREALDAFIQNNSSRLGAFAPMSAQEMAANHLPTVQQARAVVDFLRGAGFGNISVSDNRMLVTAEGSAAAAESAFNTRLMEVVTADLSPAHAN